MLWCFVPRLGARGRFAHVAHIFAQFIPATRRSGTWSQALFKSQRTFLP
jgi:hypothetical protein